MVEVDGLLVRVTTILYWCCWRWCKFSKSQSKHSNTLSFRPLPIRFIVHTHTHTHIYTHIHTRTTSSCLHTFYTMHSLTLSFSLKSLWPSWWSSTSSTCFLVLSSSSNNTTKHTQGAVWCGRGRNAVSLNLHVSPYQLSLPASLHCVVPFSSMKLPTCLPACLPACLPIIL